MPRQISEFAKDLLLKIRRTIKSMQMQAGDPSFREWDFDDPHLRAGLESIFDCLNRLPFAWFDLSLQGYESVVVREGPAWKCVFVPLEGERQFDRDGFPIFTLLSLSKTSELLEDAIVMDCPKPLGEILQDYEQVNKAPDISLLACNVDDLLSQYWNSAHVNVEDLFRYSEDYATVRIREQRFELTPQQRSVIELLHQAWKNGTPSLSKDYILSELKDTETRYDSLQKLFRDDDAFRALIRKGKRKDTYRLNLPDKEDPPQESENS